MKKDCENCGNYDNLACVIPDGIVCCREETWRSWRPMFSAKNEKDITVSVRWNDGYLEGFKCSAVRFGSDLLWMRLSKGSNRHIPLRQVRWFSTNPESHENITK